jgi:hypothetical protein
MDRRRALAEGSAVTAQTFRKRPVEVEAMRFTGGAANATTIIDWVHAGGGTASWHEEHDGHEFPDGQSYSARPEGIDITTLEGVMQVSVGNWVVRGVAGEFYPVRDDIFERTFEAVTPST